MAIATRLKWFLDRHGVCYEVVQHDHAETTRGCARAAGVPDGRVAKCVLLEDERGFLLALVPASRRIDLRTVRRTLRRRVGLAPEAKLGALFADCEEGAVPALGRAYGVPTVIDDSLLRMPDLYFEAGSHRDLVHLSGTAFRALLAGSPHGRIARPH